MLPYHTVTGKSRAPKLLRRHPGPPNPHSPRNSETRALAAVPSIPRVMYTHNSFTIVNYPELLDKQRPLPLFLVLRRHLVKRRGRRITMFSQDCPGSSSGHYDGTGGSPVAPCRRAAARLPLACTAGRDGDAREPRPAGRRRHRRSRPARRGLAPGSGGLPLADPGGSLTASCPAVPDPVQVAGAVARYMALRESAPGCTAA
jgi:hypothetical protein